MTKITPEALEALSKKATQGEAMTNPRQALEEAWNAVHDYQKAPWQALAVGNGMERFRRFLDAEAWTDAAVMLVPEGKCWHIRYDPRLTGATVMDQDGFNQHHTLAETPALAIAQAALRAKEAGDV